MKKNNFKFKIFLLILVASFAVTNFSFADTIIDTNFSNGENLNSTSYGYQPKIIVVTPTSGQSKSSNYILDYGTSANQNKVATPVKEVNTPKPVTTNNTCTNCSDIAKVTEIDVVHQAVAGDTGNGATVTVSTNVSSRNIIYLGVGLILILIMIILIIRFFKLSDSLTTFRIEDKDKYD